MGQPIETLRKLLEIPSYSGEEQAIQDHIEEYFSGNGIESFRQGGNLVVHMIGKDQTKAFMFNSHVDVVDIGDESRWKHNPWSGDIEDGKIYGRGASDMKSGVAASMETAKSLSQQMKDGAQLPCDAWFVYVEKEEVDGSGTQSFAEWFQQQGYSQKYNEVAVVFTEPTEMDTAEYGHRGNFFIKAELDGDAGHASRPSAIKVHAIDTMSRFIRDVRIESGKWRKKFEHGEFAPPTITPTATEAKSGSPNKVSDHAETVFDLRTIPGFHQEAFDQIKALADKRGIKLSLLFPDAPTGYTRRDAKIIQQLQNLIPGLKLEVSEASADLGFMTQVGAEGIILGPGERSECHQINESAPISHLEQAIDIYSKLYYAWANS